MSLPVPLERLRTAIDERGASAYLLTVSDDGSPHAVHAPVRWEGDAVALDVGRRSTANAAARPPVSLLFPVRTEGAVSLMVDATAAGVSGVDGPRVRVTPAKALLLRPAAAPDPASPCAADCVPLLPASRERT